MLLNQNLKSNFKPQRNVVKQINNCFFPQAYTSIRGSVPELKENRELAVLMNTVVLHTKLVDQQEDVVNDVADLSILW